MDTVELRSGREVGGVARAVCSLFRTTGVPRAFVGVRSWIAPGPGTQERGADGPGLRRALGGRAGDQAKRCSGVATVPHRFSLGGSGGATGNSGGV